MAQIPCAVVGLVTVISGMWPWCTVRASASTRLRKAMMPSRPSAVNPSASRWASRAKTGAITSSKRRWSMPRKYRALSCLISSMATSRATGSRSTGSVLGDLAERFGLVRARLGGETKDPLPDDVALDLLGATTDADAPLAEELLLPEPVLVRAGAAEHRVGALDRERQVAVAGGVLGDRELRDRALGSEGPAGARRDLGSLPEPLEDLE